MGRMYEFDQAAATAAKQADEKSGRIDESGEYVGIFKHAIAKRSSKGTEGIEFHFEMPTNQKARITVWTHKATGEPLSGFKIVSAIMACMRLRGVQTEVATIEQFDRNKNANVPVQVDVYSALQGKPIGLLLQLAPEEYMKAGVLTVANKLEIYAVFDAQTRLVASEILGRVVQPAQLDKIKASLRDRPIKRLRDDAGAHGHGPAPTGGFDDFEDDIPF